MLILSEATDAGSETKLGAVLRQAQLSNVTIYSVGLSTTMAELKAPPKDTTPQVTPPGTFGRPPFPGSVQTPGSEGALYGSGDLMAVAVWAVQHVKNKITDHALELAATATGGELVNPRVAHFRTPGVPILRLGNGKTVTFMYAVGESEDTLAQHSRNRR